jgi:hypothetical protein
LDNLIRKRHSLQPTPPHIISAHVRFRRCRTQILQLPQNPRARDVLVNPCIRSHGTMTMADPSLYAGLRAYGTYAVPTGIRTQTTSHASLFLSVKDLDEFRYILTYLTGTNGPKQTKSCPICHAVYLLSCPSFRRYLELHALAWQMVSCLPTKFTVLGRLRSFKADPSCISIEEKRRILGAAGGRTPPRCNLKGQLTG